MDATLEDARARYQVAYESYRVRAARIAQAVSAGGQASDEDIKAEEHALSELTTARRLLLDAIATRGG